jgi:hypothetical protein
MIDFVELYLKRNRGWPWPEDSWGLTPMFGEDGWCHSCGVPLREQTGSLVLQRRGFAIVNGAWVPNWQFDAICMERSVADDVVAGFRVEMREVAWHGKSPGEAMQIVVPSIGPSWFDPSALHEKALARHGSPGAKCPDCGVWRWMPLAFGMLPDLVPDPSWANFDIIASPEWFGDGWQAFRQILVRGELANLIAASSPKDFSVREAS